MKKILFFFLLAIIFSGCYDNLDEGCEEKFNFEKYPCAFLDKSTFDGLMIYDTFSSDDELLIIQKFVESIQEKFILKPYTVISYKQLHELEGDMYSRNTIFIGTCNTKPHNQFVNLFLDCLSMENDIAMMRIFEKNNSTIISVVGKDYKDTEEALYVLENYANYNLSGNEIQVRNDESGAIFIRTTG